jgi:hypothetical protein
VLIGTLSMVAVCVLSYSLQSTPTSPGALVNREHPGAYVTVGQDACRQTGERRLVLHNNYQFPIVVTLIGSASGDTAVSHEVVAKDRGKSRVVEQVAEELSTMQTIEPSRQISFCISFANISASRYVRIPFKIAGETDTPQAAAPEHFALFYGEPPSEPRK